jgi:hypothetical protein
MNPYLSHLNVGMVTLSGIDRFGGCPDVMRNAGESRSGILMQKDGRIRESNTDGNGGQHCQQPMLCYNHAMTVEGSANEVIFGETWRGSRATKRVKQVPDHVEFVDEWLDFIGVFQPVFAS